jgi:hypothetical protein
MLNPAKRIVLGAALLVGTTIVANADPLSRTADMSAASGAAVPSGARPLSGNEVAVLPPPEATLTRDSIALPGGLSRCSLFASLHERRRPEGRSKRQIEG